MLSAVADDTITRKGAADLIGVSESTVRRACDDGAIPVTRTPGGHRRIRRSDVEALAARLSEPETAA